MPLHTFCAVLTILKMLNATYCPKRKRRAAWLRSLAPRSSIGVCSPAVAYLGSQQAAPPRLGRQSMRVSPCGASRRRRQLGCAYATPSRRAAFAALDSRHKANPGCSASGSRQGLRKWATPTLACFRCPRPGRTARTGVPQHSRRIPAATRSGPLTTPARSPPGSAKGCALPGWFGGRLPSSAGQPCRGLCVRSRCPF